MKSQLTTDYTIFTRDHFFEKQIMGHNFLQTKCYKQQQKQSLCNRFWTLGPGEGLEFEEERKLLLKSCAGVLLVIPVTIRRDIMDSSNFIQESKHLMVFVYPSYHA